MGIQQSLACNRVPQLWGQELRWIQNFPFMLTSQNIVSSTATNSVELVALQCRSQGHADVDYYLSCCRMNLCILFHNKGWSAAPLLNHLLEANPGNEKVYNLYCDNTWYFGNQFQFRLFHHECGWGCPVSRSEVTLQPSSPFALIIAGAVVKPSHTHTIQTQTIQFLFLVILSFLLFSDRQMPFCQDLF